MTSITGTALDEALDRQRDTYDYIGVLSLDELTVIYEDEYPSLVVGAELDAVEREALTPACGGCGALLLWSETAWVCPRAPQAPPVFATH